MKRVFLCIISQAFMLSRNSVAAPLAGWASKKYLFHVVGYFHAKLTQLAAVFWQIEDTLANKGNNYLLRILTSIYTQLSPKYTNLLPMCFFSVEEQKKNTKQETHNYTENTANNQLEQRYIYTSKILWQHLIKRQKPNTVSLLPWKPTLPGRVCVAMLEKWILDYVSSFTDCL